jgi:hypothetical protein
MQLHAILEITDHCDYSNSFANQEVQKKLAEYHSTGWKNARSKLWN